MVTLVPCAAGCGRKALTGSPVCAVHAADPKKEVHRIGEYITQREIIKDINASGLSFENMDFSHRQFFGCYFGGASFSTCSFAESFIRMSFFDFSRFETCNFATAIYSF